MANDFYEQVYRIVRLVPHGQVVTYGQVAAILQQPRAARAVGYALFNLCQASVDDVPWQRVVNAQGLISSRGQVERADHQKRLLQQEGVEFGLEDRIDLKKFRWSGPALQLLAAT